VYRIVGFLEYAKALEFLVQFVETASSQELDVANEIIREREPFVVYVNLSRLIEGNSSLSDRSRNSQRTSQRRGLEWVMALARVELGGMLAGFTSHPQPFQATAPGTGGKVRVRTAAIDAEAYREILTDGMRVHYWTLRRDPAVRNYYTHGVPENHLLTYGRRSVVARKFLQAARRYSLDRLSKTQLAEMNAWDNYFKKIQLTLLYCLSRKVGQERRVTTQSEKSFRGSALAKSLARDNLGTDTRDRSIFNTTSPPESSEACRLPAVNRPNPGNLPLSVKSHVPNPVGTHASKSTRCDTRWPGVA
jgi:hypothetical protein